MNKQIIVVIRNGVTYRFTDVVPHGTHYSARMILDNGNVGSMIHRITLKEIEQATIEQEGK